MIIINILFWTIVIFLSGIGLLVGIKYLYLKIHDHHHPRYNWDDAQEKVSPLEQAENGISPKPLTLHQIENIVNKIEFKNYE